MAKIYFAKLNVNEHIFRVYRKEMNLQDLLFDLFSKFNDDIELRHDNSNFKYKFADLTINESKAVINGRLGKVYDEKEASVYIEKSRTIKTSSVSNATEYIAFSFDVMKEVISFIPKQTFSRKEFVDAFSKLVTKMYPEIGYLKIYLLPDTKTFDYKFSKVERLRDFSAVIIPPNSSSGLFNNQDGIRDELQQANAKEMEVSLKSDLRDPLRKNSPLINKIKELKDKGYAYIKASGRDKNNREIKIDTENDEKLLMTQTIESNLKNSPDAIYLAVNDEGEDDE